MVRRVPLVFSTGCPLGNNSLYSSLQIIGKVECMAMQRCTLMYIPSQAMLVSFNLSTHFFAQPPWAYCARGVVLLCVGPPCGDRTSHSLQLRTRLHSATYNITPHTASHKPSTMRFVARPPLGDSPKWHSHTCRPLLDHCLTNV